MVIQDEEGRWWAKHPNTGEWYYHDGNNWLSGVPLGYRSDALTSQRESEQRSWQKQKEVVGAIAVGFAGAAWVAFSIVALIFPTDFLFESPSLHLQEGALLLTLVGMLVGLTGLYIQQAAGHRRLGTLGFLLASMGITYLLVVTENLLFVGTTPAWMVNPLVVLTAQLARFAGLVLLGIAFLQARVLPRWGGMVFIGGGLLVIVEYLSVSYIPMLIDSLFLFAIGLAWLALGYSLWPKGKRLGVSFRAL